jgi:hypothetical protein
MLERGWRLGSNGGYRPELGLDTAQLFEFIGATQADAWAELKSFYGNDPDAAQRGFARRLDQAIGNDGLLSVLRKGVKDRGVLAHHSYAPVEAGKRGLAGALVGEFPPAGGLVADALTYCDMTTSPDGDPVDVATRLAEVTARYGAGDPVTEAIEEARPQIEQSVRVVRAALG